MFSIDLNKLPINRGLAIGIFVFGSFLPAYLYIYVFHRRIFEQNDHLENIILSLSIGTVTNFCYLFLMILWGEVFDDSRLKENRLSINACMSTFFTALLLLGPILIYIILPEKTTGIKADRFVVFAFLFSNLVMFLGSFTDYKVEKKRAKNQVVSADVTHSVPEQNTSNT